MAAIFFYGWLIIALSVFICIICSLYHDKKIRDQALKVRTMIRESERRG